MLGPILEVSKGLEAFGKNILAPFLGVLVMSQILVEDAGKWIYDHPAEASLLVASIIAITNLAVIVGMILGLLGWTSVGPGASMFSALSF
jgi:hypothetical protein